MAKFNLEQDIALRFVEEKDCLKKINIVNDIPPKFNYNKILKHIKNKSEKNIFQIIINLNPKKEKKSFKFIIQEFKNVNGDKDKICFVLNILKLLDKQYLVEKSLNEAIKKIKKHKDLFEKLLESESIITLIKNNSFSSKSVKDVLEANKQKIGTNEIILNHLKDSFTYDENLIKFKNNFNEIALELPELETNFFEENKTLQIDQIQPEIAKNSDLPPLESMGIEQDYNLENLNKRIPKKDLNEIDKLLINIFNTIQTLEGKTTFVKYIRDFEYENLKNDEFLTLSDRYAKFKGSDMQDLSIEINNISKDITAMSHIKKHFRDLQEEALFGMNKIIRREIILKMLIKKVVNLIMARDKDFTKTNHFYFITKELDKEEINIKVLITNLNDLKNDKTISQKLIREINFELLEDFIKHYIAINKEKTLESNLLGKIIQDIKKKNFEEKIRTLESIDRFLGKQLKNEKNKQIFNEILNYWIKLYRKIGNIRVLSDDELLFEIEKEFALTNNIEKIKERLKYLPDDKKFLLITKLSLNPKFAVFYNEIKEILFNLEGGSLLNNIILKIKQIERQLGFDACLNFLDDLVIRFTLTRGESYFMVKKLSIIKDNIVKLKTQNISIFERVKLELSKCNTITEKLILLKKMSNDDNYKSSFSYIKKMEAILVKNDFESIFTQLNTLSLETQKQIIESLLPDFKEIFKDEPKSLNIILRKLKEINIKLKITDESQNQNDDGFVDYILTEEQNKIDLFMDKQVEDSEKGIRIIRGKEITVMGGDLSHIYHKEAESKPEIKALIIKIRNEIDNLSSPYEKIKKLELWKKLIIKNKTKNNSHLVTVIDNYLHKIEESDEVDPEFDKLLLIEINEELKLAKNKYNFLKDKLLDPKYKRIRVKISTLLSKFENAMGAKKIL